MKQGEVKWTRGKEKMNHIGKVVRYPFMNPSGSECARSIYVAICGEQNFPDGLDLRLVVFPQVMTLPPKFQSVLLLRFGASGKPMTYQSVGMMFGVSRNRIMQILHKSLRILKHPDRRAQIRVAIELLQSEGAK